MGAGSLGRWQPTIPREQAARERELVAAQGGLHGHGEIEHRERLEQLRALENGMRIDPARVDTVPFGVDTPGDLARARDLLAPVAS